ncbi:MAG: hypothetical protein KDM91_12245, partial [Verrucomicrobiae bacterium]|nr:hypothetical protein [Verrucomicrobiae bacterium]
SATLPFHSREASSSTGLSAAHSTRFGFAINHRFRDDAFSLALNLFRWNVSIGNRRMNAFRKGKKIAFHADLACRNREYFGKP